MALNREQERLCQELGDKAGLSASLGLKALLLKAVALYKQVERLCRELGNPRGPTFSLANQAILLASRDPREALRLAEEAYEVAVRRALTQVASQIKRPLDQIRALAGGKKGGIHRLWHRRAR